MTAIASMFDEALRHPSPGYALGKRVAELYPGRSMVELDTSLFNTWAFKQGGHCAIEVLADVASSSRARRAADGYAGQLQRRPRLDRSA